MFSALVTPFASLWVTGLLILWAVLLFGGFVFGRVNAGRTGRMPLWTRLASSAVLVLAAWSWYVVSRGTTTSLFALLIAIGMTLGLDRRPVHGPAAVYLAVRLASAWLRLGWDTWPTSPPG